MSGRSSTRADLGLVVVTMIWGVTFPAIRTVMATGTSPLAFIALRFCLAGAILVPIVYLRFRSNAFAGWRPALMLGLILGAAFAVQTIGLIDTTAARSGFITGTTVAIVPFLERVVFRRALSRWAILGAAVVMVGLFVLSEVSSVDDLLNSNVGDAWTLACAFLYAVYLVLLQPHLAKYRHTPFLTMQIVAVAIAATAVAPFVEDMNVVWKPEVFGALAFLVVFATIGTGLLQFRFQERSSPVRAALIFSLEPVFAALFAMVLIGERPGWHVLVGGSLMVLGVIVSEVGPRLFSATDDR